MPEAYTVLWGAPDVTFAVSAAVSAYRHAAENRFAVLRSRQKALAGAVDAPGADAFAGWRNALGPFSGLRVARSAPVVRGGARVRR